MDHRLKTYIAISTALVLLFLGGAAAFFLLIPPFENSDELGHVGYVLHVMRHRELPRVVWPSPGVSDQVAMQTPLYYISAALPLPDAPEPVRPRRDREFQFTPAPPGEGPHRMYRPITGASSAALRAMAAACSRVRMVSIFWGLLAAISASALLWQLTKGNSMQAALALAIFLLNPRWIESAASAGNDVAATAAATILLLFLMRLPAKPEITFRDCALLGFGCALATLTKLNNIGLILMGILAVALKAKQRVPAIAILLASWALPLAPWLIRNHLLYGDLLMPGPELLRHFVAIRVEPLGLGQFFAGEFQGFRWSYFAVFGQFAVLADPPIYPVLDAFLLVCGTAGIAALILDFRNSREKVERILVLFPLLWIAILFAEFANFNRTYLASQGRYLYPASPFIAYVLARGCLLLTPAKARTAAAILVSAIFAAFAFYVAFSVLPRAYPVSSSE